MKLCVASLSWVLVLSACSSPRPMQEVHGVEVRVAETQMGMASRYTDTRTASGERYSASALAAAHKTWPLGTKVRVTDLSSGRSVVVRINDRGPYARGRVIDLTLAAAEAIGLTRSRGIGKVKIERLEG